MLMEICEGDLKNNKANGFGTYLLVNWKSMKDSGKLIKSMAKEMKRGKMNQYIQECTKIKEKGEGTYA